MAPTSPFLQENEYLDPKNYTQYHVIRRSGDVVAFIPEKIAIAMTKAYLAVHGNQSEASASIREVVKNLTQTVVKGLLRSRPEGGTFHIEDIQDMVELALMRGGHHEVARAYVLYREQQHQKRLQEQAQQAKTTKTPEMYVTDHQGQRILLDMDALHQLVDVACQGLNSDIKAQPIINEVMRNLYDGMPLTEVFKAAILAARTKIEHDPDYSFVTARLLLHTIRQEVLGRAVTQEEMQQAYATYFPAFIQKGIEAGLLDKHLAEFDLQRLGAALKHERDLQFDYLGLQTLYDRYFLHISKQRIELPQAFFMRVAMGLALNEKEREARAIEFYELLSSFDFMSSTPTLFNSGTVRSQLSSCYLTTIADDLNGIFEGIKENALLSKFAGGLGNDWSRVRALGSHIKGTNGESQGIVPFLKVVNDTAVAVNQGGKRKGAVCAYLESWHLDVEEFLELRKNTGDDRRRTHDMNTANWIPDPTDTLVVWPGSIASVSYPKNDRAEVNCTSIEASLQGSGLKRSYNRNCDYAIYSDDCSLRKSLYAVTATVTALDGLAVTCQLNSVPVHSLTYGFIEWKVGDLSTESRGIESAGGAGGSVLTLIGGTAGLRVGQAVTV